MHVARYTRARQYQAMAYTGKKINLGRRLKWSIVVPVISNTFEKMIKLREMA